MKTAALMCVLLVACSVAHAAKLNKWAKKEKTMNAKIDAYIAHLKSGKATGPDFKKCQTVLRNIIKLGKFIRAEELCKILDLRNDKTAAVFRKLMRESKSIVGKWRSGGARYVFCNDGSIRTVSGKKIGSHVAGKNKRVSAKTATWSAVIVVDQMTAHAKRTDGDNKGDEFTLKRVR